MKTYDFTLNTWNNIIIPIDITPCVPSNDNVTIVRDWSPVFMYALEEMQAMDMAHELSKWFKTDSVFDVYATGQQIKSPILEVVK